MLRKLTLGIVAAATLGLMALAPTTASAGGGGFKGCCGGWGGGGGFGGGWGYHHHWGHGYGIGFIGGVDDGCYVTRRVMTPFGLRLRTVNVCEY
jgi:hypothetical protein